MNVCQKLTTESPHFSDTMVETGDDKSSTTLLHLSSMLGLCRLTCSLLHWAAEPELGAKLGREVDALCQDGDGFTPLVSENIF